VKERAELGICSLLAVNLLNSLRLEDSGRRSIDAVGVARARSRERNGWQARRRRKASSGGLVLLNGGESLLSAGRFGATGEEVGDTVAF
jgi:hypothetical protein